MQQLYSGKNMRTILVGTAAVVPGQGPAFGDDPAHRGCSELEDSGRDVAISAIENEQQLADLCLEDSVHEALAYGESPFSRWRTGTIL
jgi:hypothetical protein